MDFMLRIDNFGRTLMEITIRIKYKYLCIKQRNFIVVKNKLLLVSLGTTPILQFYLSFPSQHDLDFECHVSSEMPPSLFCS